MTLYRRTYGDWGILGVSAEDGSANQGPSTGGEGSAMNENRLIVYLKYVCI